MKEHVIFQTINDLGIKNENDIYSVIKNLSQTDAKNILDRMDNWYRKSEMPSAKNSVFDFWIPSTNSISLNSITANLLFANSINLSDPLCDLLCFLEDSSAAKWVFNEHMVFRKHVCTDCLEGLRQIEKEALTRQISGIVGFYLKNRALIENGIVIPYVDVSTKFSTDVPLIDLFRTHDDAVNSFYHRRDSYLRKINKIVEKGQHSVNQYTSPILEEWIVLEHQKRPSAFGMLQFLLTQSDIAPSVDFLDNLGFGIMNGLIKFLGESAKASRVKDVTVPYNLHYFNFPTLSGLNSESLLEILDHDKDSLKQFKEFIVTKTSAISSPYMSPDWQSQMDGLRAEINRKVIELERTLKDIKKDYLKRQAENIVLMVFSVGLASLSVTSNTVNPMSIIQGVASGAGLTTSIKSLIDSFLEYQSNVNEQKRNDVFFLWRLSKDKF